MSIDMSGSGETPATGAPRPLLDYYVVLSETGVREPSAPADGIVVEEFVFADDCTATGLNGAGWTAADGGWWSSAAFSRAMRADPRLRGRVVPVRRHDAEIVYRRLGGGELPGEPALRIHFRDRQPLTGSAPLLFGPPQVPEGFHDMRVYRILFANELGEDRLARLLAVWKMAPADDFADPRARVAGTAHLRVGGDLFSWDLRRIGPGVAWCLDLTACLGGPSGKAIGPLLRELTTVMRFEGLIPVTVERFS
ncbi:hypothetical protein [Sphaerisporangium perillae]|uniref:hypothetical protein n=1 Tax=Sphaerisporangium perillae TaxID=2935860 RepID=UPI00200F19FC|nr:hypothetical protein [Sphaerisporangium perillae]